jgi:hypothetical protein
MPAPSTDEGDALRALASFPEWDISRDDGFHSALIHGTWDRPGTVVFKDADFCLAVCGAILQAAEKEKQP